MKWRGRSEVASVHLWSLRREDTAPHRDGEGWRSVIPAGALDVGLALGVAALGVASGLGARHQGQYVPAAAIPVLAAMGLVLFPRRRCPGSVLVVVASLVAGLAVMRTSLEGTFVAVLVAGYAAAVYGSRRLAWALGAGSALTFVAVAVAQALGAGAWVHATIWTHTLLAAAGAWIVGLVLRGQFSARGAHLAELRERAEWIASRQEEERRRAAIAERLRIAREMHDIVAHHLSVVVIQAQGAQRTVERDQARAATAMADVERTGRMALEEMRRLLGLLRSGEPADNDIRDPLHDPCTQPMSLADVDTLAERMRTAGLGVTVQTSGHPREVPADVGLAVYRIVQEALTNVLKHAGPAEAVISLAFSKDLDITVTDDGRGAAASLAARGLPGAGRGTAGMRERVAALGGRISAGPQPGGGYRVHTTIPLDDS
jgi:signal transduction histidine kinase